MGTKILRVELLEDCEECHGSGYLRDDELIAICPFCSKGDEVLKQTCIEICKENKWE